MTTRRETVGQSQGYGTDRENMVSGTFKCETCGRKFEHKKDLLKHAYIHKENPNYDCQTCGKFLTSKVGYDRHMGTHAKANKGTVYCKICALEFPTKSELEKHHRDQHLEQKPFSCEICKVQFSWEENLHKHRRMHLVENYQCEVCNKVFVDTISLKVHMRSHNQKKDLSTNLKPYGCKLCGQRFQYDFSYNAHMRFHNAGLVEGMNEPCDIFDDGSSTEIPTTLENEDSQSYETFLGKRPVHLKRKSGLAQHSQLIKQSDPELQNATILPAFEPPNGYRPYPQIRGITTPTKTRNPTDFRRKGNKLKSVIPNNDKKLIANKRFGDLTMTEETPHKCHTCLRSFRWEVSLNIHMDEHVNGVKKLSDAELRRQKRFAIDKKRQVKKELVGSKTSTSPKKSRLVKRKAGSDDEDSGEETYVAGGSPNKANKRHTGQTKRSTSTVKTYSRGDHRNQPAQLSEPSEPAMESSQSCSGAEPNVIETGVTVRLQSDGFSVSDDGVETQESPTRKQHTETAMGDHSLSQARPDFHMETNSMQYDYDSPEPTSSYNNQMDENEPNIHSQSNKRSNSNTNLDVNRSSRRSVGENTHFDTINTAQVLDKYESVSNEPIMRVADAASSDGGSSYNAYETNVTYANYPENIDVKPKLESPNGQEQTQTVSDFSSIGSSLFYPSESHGSVIANIINDDKTVEQVRVVECVRLRDDSESTQTCEEHRGHNEFISPTNPPFTYDHPANYTQVDDIGDTISTISEQIPISQGQVSESATIYTDLSHSTGNLQTSESQTHFTDRTPSIAHSAVPQVPISHISTQGNYHTNRAMYQWEPPLEEHEQPGPVVANVATYFDNGQNLNPTSASHNIDNTQPFTQLIQSSPYGNPSTLRNQHMTNYEQQDRNAHSSTTVDHNASYVVPPLFVTNACESPTFNTSSNTARVSSVSEFIPFQGSMLDALQSQSPISTPSEAPQSASVTARSFEPTPVPVYMHTANPEPNIPPSSIVDSNNYNTETQRTDAEPVPRNQPNVENGSYITQMERQISSVAFQSSDVRSDNQIVSQSHSSRDITRFQPSSFCSNARTEQTIDQTNEDVINNSEQIDVILVSEPLEQPQQVIKEEQTVYQNQTVVSSHLPTNQNASILSTQSVVSQQVAGSSFVLENGSLVQSHVAQRALSTDIQERFILNNQLQASQIQIQPALQTMKSPVQAAITLQQVVNASPNGASKSKKRKEKNFQPIALHNASQPQLPVVINHPRLTLPVSHPLFPQQNMQQPQQTPIFIQNPNGTLQAVPPAGGIQIVNNQGTLQTLQPQSGIQVFTNQGIQTIQPQGGLQVVQNVQDGVSLLGNQSTQGGYHLVQTPNGIQMIPIQPTFQPIQTGLPIMPAGYQSQNMGPISMINMNITNNLQAPMQTFPTNLPTLQNGMPMMSGPIQPMGTNVMQPQIVQCMNQSGELVAVTPLFQIPVDQMQPTHLQGNIMGQHLNLSQGLVHVPLNMGLQSNAPLQSLNFAMPTSLQQHSDSPLNMVCKENPFVNSQDKDDEDEKIDVIHT